LTTATHQTLPQCGKEGVVLYGQHPLLTQTVRIAEPISVVIYSSIQNVIFSNHIKFDTVLSNFKSREYDQIPNYWAISVLPIFKKIEKAI